MTRRAGRWGTGEHARAATGIAGIRHRDLVVLLVDDLTGDPADATVKSALDKTEYQECFVMSALAPPGFGTSRVRRWVPV